MKAAELVTMINTAEQLGFNDIDVVIECGEGREGEVAPAEAKLARTGDQREPGIRLIMRRES